MKNVTTLVLPTNDASTIRLDSELQLIAGDPMFPYVLDSYNKRVLYALSSDKPEPEDYVIAYIDRRWIVRQVLRSNSDKTFTTTEFSSLFYEDCHKIELSTDKTLNLPEIPHTFVKTFCKNNGSPNNFEYAIRKYGLVEIQHDKPEAVTRTVKSTWTKYDFDQLNTHPPIAKRYWIWRVKCDKTHQEQWNGSGWSSSNNEELWWSEISTPKT